jgi:hypothetical protein
VPALPDFRDKSKTVVYGVRKVILMSTSRVFGCITLGAIVLLSAAVMAQSAAPLPNTGAAPSNSPQSTVPPVVAAAPGPYAVVAPGPAYIVIDPETGNPAPILSYTQPMRQPREVLPYVEEYHSQGLINAGAITLGVLYATSLSVAAANNFNSTDGWLAVPIAGPFGWLAARKSHNCTTSQCTSDESNYRVYAALDGMGQIAGAVMLIVGLAVPHKRLILVDRQAVYVAPYVSSTSSGIGLVGSF